MLDDQLRLRSFMFLPAHNRRFLDKSIVCDADAVILDLEDSVPCFRKEEARQNIIAYSEQGLLDRRKNVFVRINSIESEEFISDIEKLTLPNVECFMHSKINTPSDIEFLDRLLGFYERKKGYPIGKYRLAPLIETANALDNVSAIAKASRRLVALCLGGEDYLNDLGSIFSYQESALAYPRATLVNTARANGLLPIDTPYLDIKNQEGFAEHCAAAYRNGFAGCLILSPRQISVANEAFYPDAEKILLSKRVMQAIHQANEENGSGVAVLDGMMIGPPMRKKAEAVMRQIGEDR